MLNTQQNKAVKTKARRVLVLAGPGSGKTRVLVERVGHLVDQCQCSGHDILLLTFTRKAAGEMAERIADRVSESTARKITIGTFHSVCLRILKQWGERIGYNPDALTVYDDTDQKDILDDIIDSWPGKIKKKALYAILQDFGTRGANSIQKHRHESPSECKIIDEYISRVRENNAVDYGLILTEAQRLFGEVPEALEYYRSQWKHILIDEYQDTDRLQYNLHTIVEPDNLFCVGDSDQAIYKFRGATVEILLDFETDYFESEIIELPLCYRCGTEIIDTANTLIQNNQNRIAKSIEPAREVSGAVEIITENDEQAEAESIVRLLKNDSAVLSRTKAKLEPIAKELDSMGIKYIFVGRDSDYYSRPEIKLFHAMLSLAVNKNDNLAFMRMKKHIGINELDYSEIRMLSNMNEESHLEAYERKMKRELFGPEAHKECGQDAVTWARYISDHGLINQELVERIEKWRGDNGTTITEYLQFIQQRDIQDDLVEADDCIKLMTVHAAKGLEFDTVCVAGLTEGHMPHKKAVDEPDIEEERRLMYVAITRAKYTLVLSYPVTKTDWRGQVETAMPSRFIADCSLSAKQTADIALTPKEDIGRLATKVTVAENTAGATSACPGN